MKQNLLIVDYAVRILVNDKVIHPSLKNKGKIEIIPDINSLFR